MWANHEVSELVRWLRAHNGTRPPDERVGFYGLDVYSLWDSMRRPWLDAVLGRGAIGVVYDPHRERGNYVPTVLGRRYDALCYFEETTPLRPLHRERPRERTELETFPTGR